jgi:8-oxo-dGTP diphosphatase
MKPVDVLCGVIVKNGQIFAARKPPGKKFGGLWEFPGGKRHDHESEKECLTRELNEELNIKADVKNLISRQLVESSGFKFNLIAYFVEIGSDTVSPTEHDKTTWLDEWQLFSLQWSPADIDIVKLIVQKKVKLEN